MLRNVQKVKINEVKVRADNQYTKDENEIKGKNYLTYTYDNENKICNK